MNVEIKDKVIVVTGSSKGIGKELVRAFAQEKAKVVINYLHSEQQAQQLYHEICEYNPNCICVKADVTVKKEVKTLYHETVQAFGRVDVLINNAGICDDNRIQLMTDEQWSHVLDVNLTGAYLCSKYFSKAMIGQGAGKIINISSLKGKDGCEGQVNYSASKAGLIGLTKALAKELGQHHIAVNAVCPGFIVTDLNRHNHEKQDVAKQKSTLPCDTSMQDLVHMLLFLSSDWLSGISGQVFHLDSRIL